ncbi:MAG: pyridoxamine 5'-phosphate oxidase family protein [Acidimicrobiales bacterium]
MYGSPKESGVDAGRLIVEISEDECQQLLASKSVGRLAVSTDVGPEIFPVNYGVLDGSIVLWAAAGTKLDHASFDRVAFEVDDLDAESRTGWVVEAKGRSEDITDTGDKWTSSLREVPVRPWVAGPHPNCVAILRPRLSGRRLVPAESASGADPDKD